MTLLAGLVLATLSGCTRLRYYAHLAGGQWQLLHERRPIAELLASSDTAPELKYRLQQVVQARNWAVDALGLPDNGSYRNYADLGRPYVMWNVFATPEFSLHGVEHCFPFAGCVAYQGYYDRAQAEARAAELRAQGYDVHVGGVPAYSTLGWFDDPVLNTMLHWDDAQLVGTVFHELAHQKLYVKDDTRFNESYASFVQQEGLRAYAASHPDLPPGDTAGPQRRTQFVKLVLDLRERLDALYAQPLDLETMRAHKAEAFAQLKADYEQLRDTLWHGDRRYDAWFADSTPNNARLLPFGLYDEYAPAFAALFERAGRDWSRFHAQAQQLARLPAPQRKAQLDRLLNPS
ncbi:aminopeptidase [Fontimonas sp. SYSU GA230001]|uniref:aminopeptidase n=1 Tax=Fontimonas sp. SYSU GA230001 TaxID=3142450 RepID=UPI0032B5302A